MAYYILLNSYLFHSIDLIFFATEPLLWVKKYSLLILHIFLGKRENIQSQSDLT
jgi:hypothetical protein